MTISLEDFDRCCRCCLTTVNAMKPIFGASLDEMLTKLMKLQITETDGYPQQICSRCVMKLSSAYTFYLTVMNSKKTLEDVLKAAEGNKELSGDRNDYDANKLSDESYTNKDNKQKRDVHTTVTVPSIVHCFPVQETVKQIHNDSSVIVSESGGKSSSRSDSGNEGNHNCIQCQHTSTDPVLLKEHLQRHLIVAKDTDPSKEEKDTRAELCNYCGARFRLRTSLHKHLRQHRGLHHQCQHCHKRFAEASSLSVHLVSHSSEPKPHRCACGLVFTQKSTLNKHEKRHEAREDMHCADCGKKFLYKSSLQRHQERSHTTQECVVCNKTYSGKTSLNAHMKEHRAEIASLEKTETNNTITDEINIQTVTVEFLCLICSKKYQTREGLELHNCQPYSQA